MPPKRRSRKVAEKSLTDEDKKRLANEVKCYPCIWNKNDPAYKRSDLQQNCWMEISKKLNISGNDSCLNFIILKCHCKSECHVCFLVGSCKEGWKSLKDAVRYRRSMKVKGKSGDAATDEEDEEKECETALLKRWKFYECMKFYITKESYE